VTGRTAGDVLDERPDVVPGLVRNERPVLDAREVEQIPDDAVESQGLVLHRARELVAFSIGPGHIALPQAAGGGEDRRERRPELVRHRVEQLCLELVGAAEGFRLGGLRAKPRALESHSEVRGGDRKESLVLRAERLRTFAREDPQASDALPGCADRDHVRGPLAVAAVSRPDQADSPGRAVRGHHPKLRADCRAQRFTRPLVTRGERRSREDLRVGVDGDAVQVECRTEVLGDRGQGPLQVGLCHEERGLVEELRITLAVLGLLRASPLAGCERASDDRGHEEQREREELFGVSDDELMRRRDEEPVESQEGEHARHDRCGRAERDRDQQDRDQVEHGYVRDLRAADHEPDEHARQRDGARCGDVRNETSHHGHDSLPGGRD